MYLEKEKPFPKVIMLSAVEDARLSERCFKEELIDKFMIKPAQNSILEEVIKKLLEI